MKSYFEKLIRENFRNGVMCCCCLFAQAENFLISAKSIKSKFKFSKKFILWLFCDFDRFNRQRKHSSIIDASHKDKNTGAFYVRKYSFQKLYIAGLR